MTLADDLREFIELLNSHKAEYLIVGAYALAFHGRPRSTGDLDILIHNSRKNAERIHRVIAEFGFPADGLTAVDFQQSGQIVQLGRPPVRIDILTSISGVSFAEAWESRIDSHIGRVPVAFIGRECLIRNKRATNRPQDRADVEALEDKP
jgi:Nucleotidyltransferase of unknown function (DUF6036)